MTIAQQGKVMYSRWTQVALLVMAVGLTGCATFSEEHYFASGPNTETKRNYFRLRINGSARFSSARYISGYYDERAVDLYFNEMRANKACEGTCTAQLDPDGKVFLPNADYDKYAGGDGAGGKITPLDPDKHGALVMILSTNANVISDTIGKFAESNVLADSIARLQHRDTLDRADLVTTTISVDQTRIVASKERIQKLVEAINAATPAANGKAAPPTETESKLSLLWAELVSAARSDSRGE